MKTVSLTTTGQEKTHFTIMLACCTDGTKLKPLIIFKRKTLPSGSLLRNIIRCNEKGWVNESIMIDWLQEISKKRDRTFFDSKGLLIMDSMKAHIKESVTTVEKKKKNWS